jgi:hopanoid biosynthesis associated RND transporter like protein HpnN
VTVVVALILALGAIAYTATHLRFKTSTRDLLPEGQADIRRYVQYDQEFGHLDEIAIVVEAPTIPAATEYAARLDRELRAREVPLTRVAYRIDPRQFDGRALLYLPKTQLAGIRDRIFDHQEFIEALAARPTLDELVHGVAEQVARGFAAGFLDLGLDPVKPSVDLTFVDRLVGQVSERLERPAPYRSPWGALFAGTGEDETGSGYFLSDDRRFLFIQVEPKSVRGSFTSDHATVGGVRAVIASLQGEFPAVRVGVTGKAALATDEMVGAFRDSERATLLALALTLGLLFVAYRRVGKPLVMLLVLGVSVAWSLGTATVVIGHLSLFSVMFVPIVIGIGIDYGIYFLFRYEEERVLGRRVRDAMAITAARAGPGMLFAAVTGAAAFFVLAFTDFRGLQELGIVAGAALLLAWLAMMTVFPAALVLVDRRRHAGPATLSPAMAIEVLRVPAIQRMARRTGAIVAVGAGLTAVSLAALPGLRFDYNLLNLQARGTESVEWERQIRSSAGRSGFAALASAHTLDELRRKHDAFARLGSVAEVDSALRLIPDDQDDKLKMLAAITPLIGHVRVGRPLPIDVARLLDEFETLKRRLSVAATEAPPGEAQQELRRVTGSIEGLLAQIRRMDTTVSEAALTNLQQDLYRDFVSALHRLQENLSPRRIGLEDLPQEIRDKFISPGGTFLLRIHPAVDIWERAGAERFVTELRTVDREVTGTPVVTHETIRLMERSYRQGTLYALVLVAAVTVFMLRRLRPALLALMPLALGMTWTAGLMHLFDLSFTMGNVFALPLIIGAGAEYGLNVVLRSMQPRHPGAPPVARSTVMGVLVSGLSNIVGFGSLMLAAHRGIFGLGLLLTLGTAACLTAALVILPLVLQLTRPLVVRPLGTVRLGELARREGQQR